MKQDFGAHTSLVRQARNFGMYGYKHKFEGFNIIKGMKVSRIIGLFGNSEKNWLWGMLESMVGKIDKDKFKIFSPAVFFLNLHYRLIKDRSEDSMRDSNLKFLKNCIICAKIFYCFINPKRYAAIQLAKHVYELVENNCTECWKCNGETREGA